MLRLKKLNLLPILFVLLAWVVIADDAWALSKKEIKEGREFYEHITKQHPPYPDEELQKYVSDLGNKLAAHSELPDIDWTFTVLDDPTINALATPGGFVYVNTGLMAYLRSEAQLAAVIGHEIGHVTGGHGRKKKASAAWSNALRTIAAVAVGVTTGNSNAVNSTNQMGAYAGTAMVMGYGREMELEADAFGARYMLAAGYPPEAAIEMVSTLKDHERFHRLQAKALGKEVRGYHGLFSTHPRNDKRLQNAIKAVGQLEEGQVRSGLDGEFERRMEGFKFLDNPLNIRTVGSRYYNRPMDFTVAFPSGWEVRSKGAIVQARGTSDGAVMQMRVKRLRDEEMTPEEYLRKERSFTTLEQGEVLGDEKLPGFTGIVPAEGKYPTRRIAVLFHKRRAFLFVAQVDKGKHNSFYDTLFMASLWSFRPLTDYDRSISLARQITWYQAQAGDTFAGLATNSPIKNFAEEQLRLLNGYYPYGEPKVGEWLKVVR